MKKNINTKKLYFAIVVLMSISGNAFAQSSANYEVVNTQIVPSVGVSSSSSYSANSIVANSTNGSASSIAFQVNVGTPLLAASSGVSPSASSSVSGGGALVINGVAGSTDQTQSPDKIKKSEKKLQQVYNVQVVFLGSDFATVTFETVDPAITSIGFVSSSNQSSPEKIKYTEPSKNPTSTHTHLIKNLTPNTQYLFSIFSANGDGSNLVFQNPTYEFSTKKADAKQDLIVLADVSNFTAKRITESKILLTWERGGLKETDSVLIFRSEFNFPIQPNGVKVYEGTGSAFEDNVNENIDYYYTLFASGGDSLSAGVPAKAQAVSESDQGSGSPQADNKIGQNRELRDNSSPVNSPEILGFIIGVFLFLSIILLRNFFKHPRL